MIHGKSVLAVIPARGGSKGLPGKNIMPILGRPCIGHVIELARGIEAIDWTVVSTDDPRIAEVARSERAEVIMRPDELATDTAALPPVLRHAVEAVEASGRRPDLVVLLYANMPYRKPSILREALELASATGCDSVMSLADAEKFHPAWQYLVDAEGRMRPYERTTAFRRQDLPDAYVHNGAAVVTRAEVLMASDDADGPEAFLGSDRRAVFHDIYDAVELDGPRDVRLAEALMRMESEGQ